MKTSRKIIAGLIGTFVALLVVIGIGLWFADSQRSPAARFDNHVIHEDEVNAYTQTYREENGLAEDKAWSDYLSNQGLTVQTWRERAIRQLADEILIKSKAAELGITPDSAKVDGKIADAMDTAGIDSGDEGGWARYLAERGQTPEGYREKLEFSSIEEQVFEHELGFSEDLEEKIADEYIDANYADQVVCHYYAIELPFKDRKKAANYLAELKELSGKSLEERFKELARKFSGNSETVTEDGDMGWDFAYDESTIDPNLKLRAAKLQTGELCGVLIKGKDKYRIVLCVERVVFDKQTHYVNLSESLKKIIGDAALATTWTSKCAEYLSGLEDEAHIQVSPVPSGLPYDVDDLLE